MKTHEVLDRAAKYGIPANAAAEALADELLMQPHPIWPERAKLIVQSLAQHGWANGN